MSKYIRTEDGILTVEKFIPYLLIKKGSKYVTKRDDDELGIGKYYEYAWPCPTEYKREDNSLASQCVFRVMPECDALKMVEESPNSKSDAIEKLCDAFVKKSNEPGNPYFEIRTDTTVLERKFENYRKHFEHYDYFGAIWTAKGLIYVAKMNEEGELELL